MIYYQYQPYNPINSLELLELETFKIYIKISLLIV